MRRLITPATLVPCLMIAAVAVMVISANLREGRDRRPSTTAVPFGAPGAAPTTEAGVRERIDEMKRALASRPDDTRAAVLLADALLRQARLSASAGPVLEAETILERTATGDPGNYDVMRMRATLLLSQHRFREALALADECRQMRPDDPVNYGALGDAHLELGQYPDAFEAFDRMMQLRPGPASYARVAYARELQGDLDGALHSMVLAAEASEGGDVESLAWYRSQVGELELRLQHVDEAMKSFASASQAYPGHPFAVAGYAKALEARGDRAGAQALLESLAARAPTPETYARLGDLASAAGSTAKAEEYWGLAEAMWRSDAPEPRNLARFLAEHGRKLDEAVQIAESAARDRGDVFTDDALAWAYFKNGQVSEARQAITRALRTGSKDPEILRHAAAIGATSSVVARR